MESARFRVVNIEDIAPEALKLPVRERALLAASLWESIEDPYDLASGLDDEEALATAIRRDLEIESGEIKPIGHSDLMRRVRE